MIEHEHGHHHAHGTGVRWLDLIVAVSAIFISVVSLVVSIRHGHTMEQMVEANQRMVAANTMPLLTLSSSQIDPQTHNFVYRLAITNGGVGPAVVDWFRVEYKGKPYGSLAELLRACCESTLPPQGPSGPGIVFSNVTQSILPARQVVNFIDIRPAGKDLKLIEALNAAASDLDVTACYCSVLDECWQTKFDRNRPRRVEKCVRPADSITW